jgi:hypothetical protein
VAIDADTFPSWLRGHLAARGWSAADLTSTLGVDPLTVEFWRGGLLAPARQLFPGIAIALGVAPETVGAAEDSTQAAT